MTQIKIAPDLIDDEELRDKVWTMYGVKHMDTRAIGLELGLDEHLIERVLNRLLDVQWAARCLAAGTKPK